MERHRHLALDETVRSRLHQISAASIDRVLAPVRASDAGGRRRRNDHTSAVRRSVPVRTFAESTLFKMVGSKKHYHHRAFPFPVVRLLTEVTPDIADPGDTDIDGQGQAMFWPAIPTSGPDPKPFRFQYVATDLDGNPQHFDLPAIFIDNALANPAEGDGLVNFQRAQEDWFDRPAGWRTATLNRQNVALAPSAQPGDTASEIEQIEFAAGHGAGRDVRRGLDAVGNGLVLAPVQRSLLDTDDP